MRPIFSRYRLLLALKTALGVAAAWPLGALLPAGSDAYAYYAPLGALLGVTPTVIGSIRTSAELIVGVVLGVGVGWALTATGLPWFVRAPLAAGIGVLIAGVRRLGEGRVYVAIAAVFVVILGAGDPASYASGYVVQLGIGLLVGTAVNIVFMPPLTFESARARVSELRIDVADSAEAFADVLASEWPPDRSDWLGDARRLQRSVDETKQLIEEARESGRANPRALWHRVDTSGDDADVEALRHIGLQLADISEALSGAIWDRPVTVEIPAEALKPLSDALRAVADYMRAWDSGRDIDEARRRYGKAVEDVGALFERSATESGFGSIVFALRGIRQRIDERTETARGESAR